MKGFAMLNFREVGWVEKDNPVAGLFDAIVRPLAVAPCTSDIHNVYEFNSSWSHGLILGHEVVGEVVEVGSEVKDFKPGDRVMVPPITPNWRTLEVQSGCHQHSEGLFGGYKLSVTKDGAFGEYFHVNDADMNLAHLPEDIPLEIAVMVPDMVNTGFYGAEVADITYGATVAVFGIGPVGLMSIAGAVLKGAGRIIAVGGRAICQETAKFYGATEVISYKDGDIGEKIMKITGNKGVDTAIIAGGSTDILSAAIKVTKSGGTISNVNYFVQPDPVSLPCSAWGFGMANKTIKGVLCPGGRVRMEKLIELIKYKRVDPSKLVTHIFYGLENIEKAFFIMKEKPDDLIKPITIL